ncbi:MAG: metallophosphoesterase [Reichenbachiella sp.]|uniref:metallophosphoesterase family protein n=1 Tax=Reichenbachiella sp. TaxID=2184521 RepID=UPI0032653D4F
MQTALITDLHAEEDFPLEYGVDAWKNWDILLKDIKKRNIKEIVFLGDIGSMNAHQRLFESMNELTFKYRLVLGNHDDFAEVTQTYQLEPISKKEAWYWSEESEVFKMIGLDTSTDAITQIQLDFLKREIQTGKDLILFIHHPVLQTNTIPQKEYPLEGADDIKEILLGHSGRVHIYCGHLHMDDVQTEANISQTITPASSLQLKKQSEKSEVDHIDFGYRILDFSNPILPSEVIWFKS